LVLVCKVPKRSILSVRTSSLPPLPPIAANGNGIATNHTILHLALALLHEFRLVRESPFWGYLQSLPRETVLVPLVWEIPEIGGEDGRLGLEWLRGTEAEKDMQRRAAERLALVSLQDRSSRNQLINSQADLQAFYTSSSTILPPTTLHPNPSPFLAFLHAYSLISTRAFIIDLYHLIALTPFCDILNHSSSSHTSLQSDDFVCHKCGSLRMCPHDIPSTSGVTLRLQHLGEGDRRKLEKERDTVDMIIEREVEAGEEVFNTYGEDLGDARLLVEWGFVGGDFAGRGIVWEVEDLCEDLDILEAWEEMDRIGFPSGPSEEDAHDDEEDSDQLFAVDTKQNSGILALDNDGRITTSLYAFLHLIHKGKTGPSARTQISQVVENYESSVRSIENAWALMSEGTREGIKLSECMQAVVRTLIDVIRDRLSKLHRADLEQEELFKLRDVSSLTLIKHFVELIWRE
jgi:hypothetical protein